MGTERYHIRHLAPGALAKILGLTGLVLGVVQAVIGVVFGGVLMAGMPSSIGAMGMFGLGSVVLTPLVSGAIGFVLGWAFTWAFNTIGGITLGIDTRTPPPEPETVAEDQEAWSWPGDAPAGRSD